MMSATCIGLIDYGSGNYQSVHNALEYLGYSVKRMTTPKELGLASHLILPGVGSYTRAMKKLRELHLVDELCEIAASSTTPFLGICVGMQILSSLGTEFEETEGMGIIEGDVRKLEVGSLNLPHIGWNTVSKSKDSPLFRGLPEKPCFYFLHSYEFMCRHQEHSVAQSVYGKRFTSIVSNGSFFGVQFHPEKSQRDGLQLLRNFCSV